MHWSLYLIVAPKSHRESALRTWSPNREHVFIPGGKHEQRPMSPHCLRLAPMEETAKFPIPQVDRNGLGGRKKCWGWRRNGLNGSERATNAFTLWPLSKDLGNPGQLTPKSMWLVAWALPTLWLKSAPEAFQCPSEPNTGLKPQVCVLPIPLSAMDCRT